MAGNYKFFTDDANFLGTGMYGHVYKGINESTNEEIAVKKVPKRTDEEKYMSTIRREMDIMKEISHPNLVKLYKADESDKFFLFYLEFCDAGDLDAYLKRVGTITLDQKLKIMAQCACGVRYLHEKEIVHRDLKPTNLLVKSENGEHVIKVADFGFARHAPSDGSFEGTICGTQNYLAPEITPRAQSEEFVRCSISVDVFALGVIYLALVDHKDGERLTALKVKSNPLGVWMWDRKAQCVAAPLTFDMKSDQYVNQVKIIVSQMVKMEAKDRLTIKKVCGAIKDIQDEKKAAEDLRCDRERLAEVNDQLVQEKDRIVQERDRSFEEKDRMLQEKDQLVQDKVNLEQENGRLVQEKDCHVQEKNSLDQEKGCLIKEKDDLLREKNRLAHGKELLVQEQNRLVQENVSVKKANEKLKELLRDIGSSYDSVNEKIAEIRVRLGIAEEISE